MLPLALVMEQLRVVFAQELAGSHQEPNRPARRVADHVFGLRGDQFDHHLDDVPGRAELAVDARLGDLRQQVLVQVALGVPASRKWVNIFWDS
jgi:hypothetical protein